jgi:hypothetical protein
MSVKVFKLQMLEFSEVLGGKVLQILEVLG